MTKCPQRIPRRDWIIAILLAVAAPLYAQPSFNSGSTGADGALNLTTPGTIVFDPSAFSPQLDPERDNVYHFTTINIASGVIVRLSARNLTGPVYWLASGAVTIAGTIDLNGENGAAQTSTAANRTPAYPGAGGYAGGVGGTRTGNPTQVAAQPGSGPGGGAAAVATGGPGGGGTFSGNVFLVPLVAGSGGGGAVPLDTVNFGAGGGAGGGSILIASSTSIGITGTIRATGGAGGTAPSNAGGAGAGGAIRLVAPVISGTGVLQAGRVRLETATYTGPTNITQPFTVTSTPNLFVPATPPASVRISTIGGVATPVSPTGSFTVPDVSINAVSAVSVGIDARYIPLGTVVTLLFLSESGADFSVNAPPLAGTLANSSATASVTFPAGFSRGYVKATW